MLPKKAISKVIFCEEAYESPLFGKTGSIFKGKDLTFIMALNWREIIIKTTVGLLCDEGS